MATRNCDKRLLILSETPGFQHLEINGNKLPTYKQVLFCYMSCIEKKRLEDTTKKVKIKRESAKYVVKEVLKHYERACVPTILEKTMADKVEGLWEEYHRLMKLNPERRLGNPKVQLFKDKMDKTMPFWPKDIEKRMIDMKKGKTARERATIDEDINFVRSMMTDRKYTYTGKDLITSKTVRHRYMKMQSEQIRVIEESNKSAEITGTPEFDEEVVEEDTTPTISETPKRSHKRTVKTGTHIFVPHDILKSPSLVSTAVRNQITPTALSATVQALITACDGNSESVNIHPTQSQRYRVEASKSIAKTVKSNWTPPPVGLLHWDGKLMDRLDDSNKEERLPILLSGSGGTKLLGVPSLPHKSSEKAGHLIAKASCELIEEWECADCIAGMVFDTTSSITGINDYVTKWTYCHMSVKMCIIALFIYSCYMPWFCQ